MSGHIVKITLEDTHPPVWRRIVLPEHISFYDLHRIIQTVFGWDNYHLHEFTLPDMELCITDSEQNTWEDSLSEDDTDVDDFLMESRWIRYTYDFGDDWRHKIVYEKEQKDYQERYATVIKAKGNNFEEDCGGVWSKEDGENRIPFSMETVNEQLKEIECSVIQSPEESKEMIEYKKNWKEIMQMAKEVGKLLKAEKVAQKSDRKSIQQKELEDWQVFWEERQNWDETEKGKPDFGDKKSAGQYEQMILPGLGMEKEIWEEPILSRYRIEKQTGTESHRELLQKLDKVRLRDYCKYLGIIAEDESTGKELAELVWCCLREHSEYYLYILDSEDKKYFSEILELPDGQVPAPPYSETIYRAVLLGIMEIKTDRKKRKEKAEIILAADAEKIFSGLNEKICEQTYDFLEKTNRRISCYIKEYGLIEMNALYEKYKEDFEEEITKADFFRVVFWHCRFNNFVTTLVSTVDQAWYVTHTELDIEKVYLDSLKFESELGYRPIPKEELLKWETGLGVVYPCWQRLVEMFFQGAEMESNETGELVTELYWKVANGATSSELLEFADMWVELEDNGSLMSLWYSLMDVCLHTGLPMLKGYSREEYGKLTGKNPYELQLIDSEFTEDEMDEDTPIFALPIYIQQAVMEALNISDAVLRSKRLEEIMRELGKENGDLLYFLTCSYLEGGKLSKADKSAFRLMKIFPEDESVLSLYDAINSSIEESAGAFGAARVSDVSEWEPFTGVSTGNTTYQRTERKIGRNEPCPCGSGKKYKHCCGRN